LRIVSGVGQLALRGGTAASIFVDPRHRHGLRRWAS
jgi:hypothetical protein